MQAPFAIQHDSDDGDTLADRYQMLEELGSGSFGVVYKAIEKATGEVVAIKHVRSRHPSTLSWSDLRAPTDETLGGSRIFGRRPL